MRTTLARSTPPLRAALIWWAFGCFWEAPNFTRKSLRKGRRDHPGGGERAHDPRVKASTQRPLPRGRVAVRRLTVVSERANAGHVLAA